MLFMKPYTVSSFIAQVKAYVEGQTAWQHLAIVGELSGVKHHPSGHWYFTLKDDASQIRCVLFRRDAQSLAYPLQDGMQVLIQGRVGLYERDGQTQIYAQSVQELGTGAAQRALEALTKQLDSEGLFRRKKRPMPALPHGIGVITSGSGAAIGDIRNVAQRRFPGMPIHLIPATVQGANAVPELIAAFRKVPTLPISVLIVGRGGGAKEDLQAFNHEQVVRAAFACPIPVISAVGHDIDITLLDRVADARAATPSQAAEMAVPDRAVLVHTVSQRLQAIHHAALQPIVRAQQQLLGWHNHSVLANPQRLLDPYRHRTERFEERLDRWTSTAIDRPRRAYEQLWQKMPLLVQQRLHQAMQHQAILRGQLMGLDPLGVLSRGYAYVTQEDGTIVTAATAHDMVVIHWSDGTRTAFLQSPLLY